MTSPHAISQPLSKTTRREQTALLRIGLPVLLFLITMLSTTAVGMRYMHNFRLGRAPLSTDADILPYTWVFQHRTDLLAGLPFSLTLIGILLAHEFGHYFACRFYSVRSSLPYLLPAPSLSGTFGAVIRLHSVIRSRAALIVIGASGPIAGFVVALATVALGLAWSTYASTPLTASNVQAPLLIGAVRLALQHVSPSGLPPLRMIVPHPILVASWIGLLITALNLIPAGQLDGGHIVYAISPALHRWSSRLVILSLFALGIFSWAGWILWGIILMTPAMRHPRVADTQPLTRPQAALIPICLVILVCCGTFQPFKGYALLEVISNYRHH
jgi:membrane-associated protease RseP (regulator of RpoE activity)